MSRTPKRFKQHRVTTTRPMNCYAKVSTRLGLSRHRVFFSPVETGAAVRDQESVSAHRKDDGTIIVFLLFKMWTAVRDQESVSARRKDDWIFIVFLPSRRGQSFMTGSLRVLGEITTGLLELMTILHFHTNIFFNEFFLC
ncbi:hypothetical protein TNCV_877141 [Trichonephila clavipes]|nr:hypothetical protein TNCV_877141 [Trichonephila clavipes]